MHSDKSKELSRPDNNSSNQNFNLFGQNIQSIVPLDSEGEGRLINNDNSYNSNTLQNKNQMDGPEISRSELDYYQEYKKIYLISYHLYLQKNKHVQLKSILIKRLKTIEDRMRDIEKSIEPPAKDSEEQNKAKRSRRTAEEIQRKFKCDVIYCERTYGSQGSLQQHIKLKHPQLYKKYEFQSIQGSKDENREEYSGYS